VHSTPGTPCPCHKSSPKSRSWSRKHPHCVNGGNRACVCVFVYVCKWDSQADDTFINHTHTPSLPFLKKHIYTYIRDPVHHGMLEKGDNTGRV
jgi:hypothetical protein